MAGPAGGSITSQVATLTVTNAPILAAPSITTQPQPQTNLAGATVQFFVIASGTAPLTHQWRFFGTNLPGATARLSFEDLVPGWPATDGNRAVLKLINEASRDLGASASSTLWRITIPNLAPAIVAGGLLVFTLSLDEFVLAFFTASASARAWVITRPRPAISIPVPGRP